MLVGCNCGTKNLCQGVVCAAPASCHTQGTCDPTTGSCVYPPSDGGSCAFEGACVGVGVCQSGGCACAVAHLGVVALAPGGAPVQGATVRWGARQASTDASGLAFFDGPPGPRVVFLVDAQGFATSTAVVESPPPGSLTAVVRLIPRAAPITFGASSGLRAAGTNRNNEDPLFRDAVLDLPADSLLDSDGNLVNGTASIALTPVDPSSPQRLAAPGPFVGAPDGGSPTPLEFLAMVELAASQGDQPLALDPQGGPATLHLRLPAAFQGQVAEGQALTAYWYDGPAGVWRPEPAAGGIVAKSNQLDSTTNVRGRDGESVFEWRARVTKLGWWAVARPSAGGSCARVRVLGLDGQPVPNVPVHASTVSRVASGHTGPNGEGACLDLPVGSSASVSVDDPSLSTSVVVLDGATASASCGGGGCSDIALSAVAQGCVHGRVLDLDGEPAAGVSVAATVGEGLAAHGSRVLSGPDGTFCAPAPAGAVLRLAVREVLDGGVFGVASATASVAATPAACGGTCTDAGDLLMTVSTGRLCVKGRVFDGDAGWPRAPAPLGTPVWVFDTGEGTWGVNSQCNKNDPATDLPSTWVSGTAVLVATGATDLTGRFCVDFSPARPAPTSPPAPHSFEVVPGDCVLRRRSWEAVQDWYWDFCGLDWIVPPGNGGGWQETPSDFDRSCEQENCIDIGDFDYGYLYSGSGCNRW